ncbi:allophanate hydrolase [Novosphingobium sp. CF614]|uniref:allophanate hydrolase n=1 Tax=Novosphingobium sp. CF614 TaxID=1884364 RepID=UPI0008E9985F|nr:allophanate hydrolase [Novosphingobium sp. CF614]SFG18065.1 allophanate hydrolase [Novosphingobium sp. CF614]
MELPAVLDLAGVRALYADGAWTPHALVAAVDRRIDMGDPAAFISRTSPAQSTAAIEALLARAPMPNSLPLWGVPFAVKDNIDVAGLPTTCACPQFAHVARHDAAVVARLLAAGAIVMGKTNLDQFATGLNGTRSPYGAPRSVFDAEHISGGSSSGSAVAVASGLVSFALGTDTAGSGRVPAALNNIVGIKPTPGLLSNSGLVPACASLDCISIFALSTADGLELRRIAEGFDPADPWSRRARLPGQGLPGQGLPGQGLRVGVLRQDDCEFFGRPENESLYAAAIARLGEAVVEIDYAPFREVAALLYEGPWVAERQIAFEDLGLPEHVLDPAVRRILASGRHYTAVDAFRGRYRLEALRRRCEAEWARADVLLLPTTPRSFTVAEMHGDPIGRNAALGLYTNFCNLLGLSAIAVPAGFGPDGLPFGVTLVGPAFADEALAPLADRLHRLAGCGAGIDREKPIAPLPSPCAENGLGAESGLEKARPDLVPAVPWHDPSSRRTQGA